MAPTASSGVAGRADLPRHDDVERRREGGGHLRRHDHAAARDAQDDGRLGRRRAGEGRAQATAGVAPVEEHALMMPQPGGARPSLPTSRPD